MICSTVVHLTHAVGGDVVTENISGAVYVGVSRRTRALVKDARKVPAPLPFTHTKKGRVH